MQNLVFSLRNSICSGREIKLKIMFLAFKRYGFSSYGEATPSLETANLPLDPIMVTGRVNPKCFPFTYTKFAYDACHLLNDVDSMKEILRDPNGTLQVVYSLRVSKKWQDHFEGLREYCLVDHIPVGEVLFVSTYFAVAKGDGARCRSIFNGKRLSSFCRPPPPVCLPEIPCILRMAADLHADLSGRKGFLKSPIVLTADFRHWFHQIRISHQMSRYFCLSFESNRFVRWCVLPMGFSWSPRLAQCICWAIVLGDPKVEAHGYGIRQAREECKDLAHPPSFIFIRNKEGIVCGIIFCWYDNIICMCYDNTTAYDTMKHIKRSAARAFRVEKDDEKNGIQQWKEFNIHTNVSTGDQTMPAVF